MYLESAKRLNERPRVWLFQENDWIVGHHGAQFVRFKIGEQQRTTAWFVETMVLQSHRKSGIGTRLVMQSQKDMPFSLSLGQTAEMRSILEALGWNHVAPLQTYMLMINAARVLENKLPSAVAHVASGLLTVRERTRRLLGTKAVELTTVVQLECFNDRHDDLWRDVSSCYGCAAVRDASFMNWKYVDQPGQAYIRLQVAMRDRIVGCVVLSLVEPDEKYNYRRAFIVDLVSSTDVGHVRALVRAAVEHAQALGADAVVMHVINDSIEQALHDFGFMKRTPTRHLLVSVGDKVDEARLLDPKQWLITQGDSDIDRPW